MIREIDLNDWQRFGEGAEGEAYNCKSDDTLMLKLFIKGASDDAAERHFRKAEEVRKLGLPTPKAYEIVSNEGRKGIIFERLQNKKSLNRIMADDPGRIEECAEIFATMLKKIHSTEVDTDVFPPRSALGKQLMTYAHSQKIITDTQYERVMKAYEGTDINRGVFGDPNAGNMVISNGDLYIIDLAGFSYGSEKHDMGMFYVIHNGAILPEFIERLSHMPFSDNQKFYKFVMQNYLGTKDEEEIRAYEESVQLLGAMAPVGMKVRKEISAGADADMIEKFMGK